MTGFFTLEQLRIDAGQRKVPDVHDALLPTQAQALLATFVGACLLTVRSLRLDATYASDRVTLVTDRGSLTCLPERHRLSVVVLPTPSDLDFSSDDDLADDALFRYRLRRPIQGFYAWKSYDVPERQAELEFGLEIELQTVPGFAIEYLHTTDEHDAVLRLCQGKSEERCRRLWVA